VAWLEWGQSGLGAGKPLVNVGSVVKPTVFGGKYPVVIDELADIMDWGSFGTFDFQNKYKPGKKAKRKAALEKIREQERISQEFWSGQQRDREAVATRKITSKADAIRLNARNVLAWTIEIADRVDVSALAARARGRLTSELESLAAEAELLADSAVEIGSSMDSLATPKTPRALDEFVAFTRVMIEKMVAIADRVQQIEQVARRAG
jgi:hypothetical protein